MVNFFFPSRTAKLIKEEKGKEQKNDDDDDRKC